MYGLIWSVYALASVLALICLFWLTAGIGNAYLRWAMRMPFVALCFTPVQVDVENTLWFAPSIAAIAIELVANDVPAALQFVPILLLSVLLAVAIGLLLGWFASKRPSSPQQ